MYERKLLKLLTGGVRTSPRPRGWGSYRDPVLGWIPLPPLLRQALDLPEMQRLRGIRQLSTVDLVFAGGAHGRFEHAAGVMALAARAHEVLRQKAEAILEWNARPGHERKQREPWPELDGASLLAVMLAGLFHDLGHGPFSHTYELFLKRDAHSYVKEHAEHSIRIIVSRESPHQVGQFLDAVHELFEQAGFQNANLLTPESIAEIIVRPATPRFRDYAFLAEIIDSKFDVDRLDYLPRDAHHTGVPIALDTDEIIAAYTLAKVSPAEPGAELAGGSRFVDPSADPQRRQVSTNLVWSLRLERRAATAYEAMLEARDRSYRSIYYHPTHRAAQEMMIYALQRVTNTEVSDGPRSHPLLLIKYRDDELLAALAQGYPAEATDQQLRLVYLALRERRLFEPLPYPVHVASWPARAYLTLQELREGGNERVRLRMREASEEVGARTRSEKRYPFLLDLAAPQVTDAEAYRKRVLWADDDVGYAAVPGERGDELAPAGCALVEALPHVALAHGWLPEADDAGASPRPQHSGPSRLMTMLLRVLLERFEPPAPSTAADTIFALSRDAHRRYELAMERLLIFVPAEFLNDVEGALKDADSTKVPREDSAKQLYHAYFEPVVSEVEGLFRDAYDDNRPSWGYELETRIKSWLADEEEFPSESRRRRRSSSVPLL